MFEYLAVEFLAEEGVFKALKTENFASKDLISIQFYKNLGENYP